jgi:ATP-dependent DNA ligase
LERAGKVVTMTSKSGQDLTRYFPEVAQAAALLPEQRFILDGELVVPLEGEFSFDALLQRIHPAASRVERLSRETPALFLAFDILKRANDDLAREFLGLSVRSEGAAGRGRLCGDVGVLSVGFGSADGCYPNVGSGWD